MSTTYINPALPSMVRGLYRADLREKSLQNMLDLAADLIQELIELRAEQGTEGPEWEYGVEHVQVDGWVDRELHLNRQEALDDYRACGMNCTLMRRRKAGPWHPVEQGDDDAGR